MKVFVLLAAVYGTVFGLPQETNNGSMKDLHEESYFNNLGLNVQFSPWRAFATDQFLQFGPNQAFQTQDKYLGFWNSKELMESESKSLWYTFAKATIVRAYSFKSRNWGGVNVEADGPSKYTFWGSNGDCVDVRNRTPLYIDNSGIPFGPNLLVKGNNINNSNAFKCYGFTVTDVPGRPTGRKWVTISDVQFYYVKEACLDCSNADCKAANGCQGYCQQDAFIGPKTCF